jgi:hypothetical protein
MRTSTAYIFVPALGALFAALLCGCASTRINEKYQQPGWNWQALFDGKTLNGWIPKIVGYPAGQDPLQTFQVRDGVIAVNYDRYSGKLQGRLGHLFYKEPFKAFRLALDYRFVGEQLASDPPAGTPVNSGVMFASQSPESMELNQSLPISVEGQILGPGPDRDGGQPRTTGSACGLGTRIYRQGKLLERCMLSQLTPPALGTWVHFELEVTGAGQFTESIDGKTTIWFDRIELSTGEERFAAMTKQMIAAQGGNPAVTRGYIALQSEGHPIEFRNIRLLSLD